MFIEKSLLASYWTIAFDIFLFPLEFSNQFSDFLVLFLGFIHEHVNLLTEMKYYSMKYQIKFKKLLDKDK